MGDSLELSSNDAVNGVALDTDQQCLNNGDVDLCMSVVPSRDSLVIKKMDDSDERSDADAGESDECASPSFTFSPLIKNDNDHEDDLNPEIINCDNNYATDGSSHETECDPSHSVTECDPSHSVSDKQQTNIVSDSKYEVHDTNEHCLDQASDSDCAVTTSSHCAEIPNSAADGGNTESHDTECDPSHSVSDKQQTNIVSDSKYEVHDTNEHCLDQVSDSDCAVTTSSHYAEILNSAADGGNTESQCTVRDDSCASQKPASRATSDTETANSDLEQAEDLPTAKFDENHQTDVVVDSQLQLECEVDEEKSVSDNGESEKLDGGLTCSATIADSKNSPSLSISQVSAADVAVSSAVSSSTVATVVISTPLRTSLNVSGLPTKVAVLSVTSSSGLTRPGQHSDKPLAIAAGLNATPVPSATVRSSNSSTRLMSKILQDVGLLLVSQKVFKNLASIQKQKIGGSQKKCDMELLQKLKASHQNLVAKNHGLLTADCKCWCGFHSESVNVIETHRLKCDFQGRCCYCRGEFVYRTQNQMKKHLWKVHKKAGRMIDRSGSFHCAFCPSDYSSRLSVMRHMDRCRPSFLLSSNLAPKESDKDIPVTAASKQQVQIPVVVSSSKISPATVAQTLSRTPVSTAALRSPAIVSPAVSVQVAPAARNPAPVPKLLQIGKQLFTLLPSTSVAGSTVAVSQSPAIKAVGKMALNSAIQTAQNANSALPVPVVVNNRSTSQVVSQASTVPSTVLGSVLSCSMQYSTCSVCGAFVKDKSALLIHMSVAHGSTHKMCQYCCSPDVTFPSLVELQAHIAKIHTSDCWICKTRFQPPGRLISHIADRHRVTLFKMLELRRCYLCLEVPSLSNSASFEEHMMKVHSQQFSNAGKLWEYIVTSPNADRSWYAKLNPDGTLECPHCLGQFISTSFLYRHLHLEHEGNVVRLVHCRECGKRMPSNDLLVHLTAAHTRKCSVRVSQVEVPDYGCLFIPPVGTKRLKNKKGEPLSSGRPVKRVRTAETVVISDDENDVDDGDSEEYRYIDDSSDEDFVLTAQIDVQPKQPLHRSIRARVDHRNSSVDDVHEVLESIVDSSKSETAAKRSVSFANPSMCTPAPVDTSAAAQLCNGITEDEVEIIESIVPTIGDRRQQPVSKPEHVKPSDTNHIVTDIAVSEKTTSAKAVDVHTAGVKSKSELAEYRNGDGLQLSTKPKSTSSESSAQQLMARDQIMKNSVEEVLEIDGETVLIVHDEGDDDDDDDDEDN